MVIISGYDNFTIQCLRENIPGNGNMLCSPFLYNGDNKQIHVCE